LRLLDDADGDADYGVLDQLEGDLIFAAAIAHEHVVANMCAIRTPAVIAQDRSEAGTKPDTLPGAVALLLRIGPVLLYLDQDAVFIKQNTLVEAGTRIVIPPGRLLLRLFALVGALAAWCGSGQTFVGTLTSTPLPAGTRI